MNKSIMGRKLDVIQCGRAATCLNQENVVEAGSRPGLRRPGSFCFLSLRSQPPCKDAWVQQKGEPPHGERMATSRATKAPSQTRLAQRATSHHVHPHHTVMSQAMLAVF